MSSFAQTTATGLSQLLDHAVSHDQIIRFLAGSDFTSRDLWSLVKPTVRTIETDDGVLIFDDTIEEKPYTDENDIIAWHFDHCQQRTVKGVNILNGLYVVGDVNIPVAFEIVHKDLPFCDVQTRQVKRHSAITKNEQLRQMLRVCQHNQLRYRTVLTDSWFSSKENMAFIKVALKKEFIMALKSNRTVALNLEDKRQGRFVRVDALPLQENTVLPVYIKGLSFPVMLAKQVFTNKDDSTGVLILASSDLQHNYDHITTLYQKRWNVEVFHLCPMGKNLSNPTPVWRTHRPARSEPKATIFLHPSMLFSSSNNLNSSTTSTISRSEVRFTSRHYKPVMPNCSGSVPNIS